MLRLGKSLFLLLLPGTCIGLFAYVRALVALRVGHAPASGANVIWAVPASARLGVCILSANLALLALWLVYATVYARARRRPLQTVLTMDAPTYLPFCVLAVVLTPFIPLVNRYSDVFLLLSDTFSILLVLAGLLGCFYLKTLCHHDLRQARGGQAVSRAHAARSPSLRHLLSLFLLSLTIYCFVGRRIVTQLPLSGDEPHYLLLSHSLLHDGDIAVRNNYEQRDYRIFFPGSLSMHISFGRDGTLYSIHPIGLALLLLPGYALGGRTGAVLEMNLLAALLALVLYRIAFALTGKRGLSTVLWAVTCFTTPLILYSSVLYPELPAALLLAIAYYLIRFQRPWKWIHAFGLGLCLLCLPWLQQRMILPAILLAGYHLISKRALPGPGWKERCTLRILMPVVLLIASGLAMAGYYYVLYGNALPSAPYRTISHASVFSWRIFFREGLFGLLFDQETGLFIFSPYFIFIVPGLLLMFRRPGQALPLVVLIAAVYVPCAGFYMQWRGAWSPSARYMTALVPLLLVPLATALRALKRPLQRCAFLFLAGVSGLWTYLFMQNPSLSLMTRGGINSFFEQTGNPVDVTRYFPAYGTSSNNDLALTGLWACLILLFSLLALRSAHAPREHQRRASTGARLMGVFGCYGAGITVLLLVSLTAAHTRNAASPYWARNRRILRFLSGFDYRHVFSSKGTIHQPLPGSLFRLTLLSKQRSGTPVSGQGPRFLVTGPYRAFPAGAYTARFAFTVSPCSGPTPLTTIDVVANGGKTTFFKRTLNGRDFHSHGLEEEITGVFTLPAGVMDLETRVFYYNQVPVTVNSIVLEPLMADFYLRAARRALARGRPTQMLGHLYNAIAAVRQDGQAHPVHG